MVPDHPSPRLREALVESVAASPEIPADPGTRRRIPGLVRFAGKATAVVGMRRAGKTTFVHQLRRERLVGGLSPENVPYINFEDERLRGLDGSDLGFLEDERARRFLNARERGPVVWHFDEIQNVPGWETFVRRLLDSGGTEVVVTGSSAALLSREVATSLRGRGWEVRIFPFSFEEALRHHGEPVPAEVPHLAGATRARLEGFFRNWLAAGGFPEAQGLDVENRVRLLRDYVDIAVLRDVIERHGVRNPTALRWLVGQLLGSPAGLFSAERFHRRMRAEGLAVSKDTVHELLAHLADCFLIRLVWMESASARQRMVNPRKAYPVDSGLIAAWERVGRDNRGHALETAVHAELERRGVEVTYVRTPAGREVDFLARSPDGTEELIQVSAEVFDPAVAEREIRGLVEAGAMFPRARRRLLTPTGEPLPLDPPPEVIVQPAYEWMLEDPARAAGGARRPH